MLRRVALERTNGSEECVASIIRVKRIDELGTTLAVTSNSSTLQRKKIINFYVSSSQRAFRRTYFISS
jgi:hypothetical protein